jgi:hypothetical protein
LRRASRWASVVATSSGPTAFVRNAARSELHDVTSIATRSVSPPQLGRIEFAPPRHTGFVP